MTASNDDNSLAVRLGHVPAQDAVDIIADELPLVEKDFGAYFDRRFDDYLKEDYQRYINETYAEHIKEHYSFLEPQAYPNTKRPLYGLSLSGGGIRSASFAIGVIQGLRNKGFFNGKPTLFEKLSYVSTVSGGGYAGSSLQWFQKVFGLFPFGSIDSFAGSSNSTDKSNKILSYIRQHGKYLAPHTLGRASLLATVLGSIIHSLVAYTFLFALIFVIAILFMSWQPIELLLDTEQLNKLYDLVHGFLVKSGDANSEIRAVRSNFSHFFLGLGLLSIVTYAALLLLYGLSSYLRKLFSRGYRYRISMQIWFGRMLKLLAACIFLSLVPILANNLVGVGIGMEDRVFIGASAGSSTFSAILSFSRLQSNERGGAKDGIVKMLFSGIVVILLVLLVMVVSFSVSEIVFTHRHFFAPWLFFAVTLVICIFVNINQISPHKWYRDRLMETFLKDPDVEPTAPLFRRGNRANNSLLSDMAKSKHWTPYQLINCNVILNNAVLPKYRGRFGDSFLLSALYCGSDATQYVGTTSFAEGKMTLATAMSISGAAANPNAGGSGTGESTTSPVAFLMGFLGLRLGYWAFNPGSRLNIIGKLMRPNYIWPGLFSLLGQGHREQSMLVELSDGGHFDNTGLYELVRRRIPVIVLSDGSVDPDSSFADFGNALERVRVDFGVTIRFREAEYDLAGMIPGSKGSSNKASSSIMDERYSLAERGYAIGDVVYPNITNQKGFVGKIVYIKAVMTRNLPGDLYAYKSANPTYPDKSTVDQFFDERQFESYRELGYQLTAQMLGDKKAMAMLP